MKKLSLLVAVSMVLVLAFSFGVAAQDYADSITVYNSGDLEHDPATAQDIKRFEEETGVEVKVVEVPWQYQIDKLTTIFSSKSSKVDAFVGSYFMLSNFARPGWLEPLTFPEKIKDRFSKGIVDSVTYDGTIYGAPLFIKDTVLYYRKDLLEKNNLEVPQNWDELVEVAKALTKDTDGDGNIDQYGFGYLGSQDKLGFSFRTFLYQAGGNMFNENLKPTFNSEKGVKALQLMTDLVRKHKVTPNGIVSMGEGNVGDLFLSGKFAMVESVPPLHHRIMESDLADKASMALAPKGPESRTTFLDGNTIYVSSFSKHKKTAMKFAEFMSGYESSLHELVTEGNNSPNPDVFDDERVIEKYPAEWVTVMQESVTNVKDEKYPFYLQVEKALVQEIQNAINGKKSPQKALDDAAAQVKELYTNVLGIQY